MPGCPRSLTRRPMWTIDGSKRSSWVNSWVSACSMKGRSSSWYPSSRRTRSMKRLDVLMASSFAAWTPRSTSPETNESPVDHRPFRAGESGHARRSGPPVWRTASRASGQLSRCTCWCTRRRTVGSTTSWRSRRKTRASTTASFAASTAVRSAKATRGRSTYRPGTGPSGPTTSSAGSSAQVMTTWIRPWFSGGDGSGVDAQAFGQHDLAPQPVDGDARRHLHVAAIDRDVEAGDDAVAVQQAVVQPLPRPRLLLLASQVVRAEDAPGEVIDPAARFDGHGHGSLLVMAVDASPSSSFQQRSGSAERPGRYPKEPLASSGPV